jgi:hypothetical protein
MLIVSSKISATSQFNQARNHYAIGKEQLTQCCFAAKFLKADSIDEAIGIRRMASYLGQDIGAMPKESISSILPFQHWPNDKCNQRPDQSRPHKEQNRALVLTL